MNRFLIYFIKFLKNLSSIFQSKELSLKLPSKEDSNIHPTEQKMPSQIKIVDAPNEVIDIMPMTKNVSNKILWKELTPENYFKQEFQKELIVLHFTAGHKWEHAYDKFLTAPQKLGYRMAIPFIVDKKGPKYFIQLFNEKYWAYHLAIESVEHSRNWANDKRSIAIEIVNIGPVRLNDGIWKDYYGNIQSANDIVQGRNKDADGSVKFPDEQVEAVCRLVNHLCDKFNIPRQVPQNKISFQLPEIGYFKGITTHEMFRGDKYDMGIAWPWEKMIEKCNLKEV